LSTFLTKNQQRHKDCIQLYERDLLDLDDILEVVGFLAAHFFRDHVPGEDRWIEKEIQ